MTDTSRPADLPSYRPDIDGLRAIAVTAVILFHAGVWPIRSGFVGVDIFFVISGFLIGGIVYGGLAAGQFSFAGFYARRARRILPMLLVVIAATLLLGLLLLSPSELQRLGRSAAAAAAAISNFYFWLSNGYFSPDARLNPLLMTWSLGVEEQFYLIFPLFLWLLSRLRLVLQLAALIAVTVGSLALCILLTPKAPQASFYLLPMRAWELGCGIVLAVWQAQGRWRLPRRWHEALGAGGLLALAASIVAFNANTLFPGVAALLPVAGTLALIASDGSFINRRLLAHRLPVGIGLVSYSWYLWHWPLMAFARASTVRPPSVWILLLLAAIALLLAVASWRFIETPFRRRVRARGSVLIGLLLAAGATAGVSLLIVTADGLPARFGPATAAIESAASAVHQGRCVSYGPNPILTPECVPPADGRNAIAVIGDSHAAAAAPGMQELARQRGWVAQVFAKVSCRPLPGITVWRADMPSLVPDCLRFMDQAFAWIERNPAIKTVALIGLWAGPIVNPDAVERYESREADGAARPKTALLQEGLAAAVDLLSRAGKTVIIAGDNPFWPFDGERSALIRSIPARGWLEALLEPDLASARGLSRAQLQNGKIEGLVAEAARTSGAPYIDLAAALCPDGVCQYEMDGSLLFADAHHLTRAGALRALEPWAATIFDSPAARAHP